jgi:molybdenum cofactor cytidylyltransferase
MIAAIVLAAGYSSRMGQFKPLLPIGHATALERVIDLFLATGIGEIHVVTGHHAEAIQPLLKRKGVHAIHNPHYAAGMYSSVAAGVGSLPDQAEACFVLPADMPLVRPRTIKLLAQAYESHPWPVIYPIFQGRRGHPPVICRSVLAETLHSDEPGGLRALLARQQQGAGEVAVIDEGIHLDLDTPADLARALALAECSDAPSLAECEAILADALAAATVDERIVRHSHVVSHVAQKLAVCLIECGVRLDLPVVRAASLLYDIGAALAESLEFRKVAHVIARHQDFDYSAGSLDEAAIVYLAGKLVAGDTVVSIAHEIETRSGMPLHEILESSS